MANIKNTKNNWIYYINENLEFNVFSIHLGIAQNESSCAKSYKNDKIQK